MDRKNIIFLAENCPSKEEEENRINKNLCLYSKLINGEWEFCCNNKVNDPIISETIYICDEHIDLLNKKYNMDIKSEIIKKCNDFFENKVYDLLNSPFVKSIYENVLKDKTLYSSYDVDPEKCWFLNINFLKGLPAYWFNKLIYFSSTLKGSKKQGKSNGPDFIFKNIDNKKLIGLEIVSWNWNLSDQFKNMEVAKTYHAKLYNYKSLDEYINDMKEIIKKKNDKVTEYQKCDSLYLGIVVGNTIIEYHYYVLEYVLNKFILQEQLNFNGVFIL